MAEKAKPSSEKAPKKTVAKKSDKTTTKKSTAKSTKPRTKTTAADKAASAAAVAVVSASTPTTETASKTAPAKAEKKSPTKRKTSAKKVNTVTTPPSAPEAKEPANTLAYKGEKKEDAPATPALKPQGVTRISTPPRVKQEQKNAQENKDSSRQQEKDRSSASKEMRRNRLDTESHFSSLETVGGEGNKRNKRRRNRNRNGKGDSFSPLLSNEIKVDQEELASKAWKIFLGEVNEDGLALMDDNSTREVAKRSFRVAEIFLQEEIRRLRSSVNNAPSSQDTREEFTSPSIITEAVLKDIESQDESEEEDDDAILPPIED